MGGKLQDSAIELTRGIAARTLGGARFTRPAHPEMAPALVTPKITASQEKLKKFVNRFSIAGLFDGSEANRMDVEASVTAFSLLDEGIVNQDSIVEIRPLVPFESLYDQEFNHVREKTVKKLGGLLAKDYGVKVICNPTPIIPSHDSEEPGDITQTWGAISEELDLFRHQVMGEAESSSVVAITNSYYANKIFAGSIGFQGQRLKRKELLTLRHVGRHPRENLLLGPSPSAVLESRLVSRHFS